MRYVRHSDMHPSWIHFLGHTNPNLTPQPDRHSTGHEGFFVRELARSLSSANPRSNGPFKSDGTSTRPTRTQGGFGVGKAERCYFGSRHLSQNNANPSLPQPDAHIHFSSPHGATPTDCSIFSFQALKVVQPASS